jgi:L-lactate dehydrogenase complex protein LldF
VVETDLGEFIVQLADDRPSHLIAPVLHKTRYEIGELFRDELEVDYTDDPEQLNAIARRHLREIFLTADLGISGVNFGVAETGSVCTVTNEGNGRLTTTAPRTHVAMMGMERLVPDMGSLGVMLEVLARSGTGQALSVYTNVVTGPRRPGDPDGPEELHVVILDNGRSEVLGGIAAEILGCIRCGACLNICPVYREAGGHAYGSVYPGPVGAVVTPAMLGIHQDLPYASTLCGACQEACPIRLDIPRMLLALRATSDERPFGRGLAAYASAATHPRAWRAMLASGGLLGRIRAKEGWIESLPGPGKGWTEHRAMPAPQRPTFHAWWKKHRGAGDGT